MKLWISKYALTKGLYECECEIDGGMASGGGVFEHYHGEGREWHRTRQDAQIRAEVIRHARIQSLQKQITKLERMQFTKEPK